MLNVLSSTAIVAFLATTTYAAFPTFHVENFLAQDICEPSDSHTIAFTVTHRNAVPEQGGEARTNMSLEWTGSAPPTCYTQTNEWYARVAPDTYISAADFTLELYKHHIYRAAMRWGSKISYAEGSAGYVCAGEEAGSMRCSFVDETDSTYEDTDEGEAVYPSPTC